MWSQCNVVAVMWCNESYYVYTLALRYITLAKDKSMPSTKYQAPSTIPYHAIYHAKHWTPIQLAPFIPMSFSCDFPMERFHTSHYNMLMHLAFACQCHSISWIQFQFYFKCVFCFIFSIQNHANVNLIREWIQLVEWAAALSQFQLRITCFRNIIGHRHKQSQQMICETELNGNFESTQI